MGSRLLALTVAGALALGASPASQQAQQTFRSKTNLVQLHVIVRDAEGRPVRGLSKADFSLFDSKKPRVIDVFEEVSRPEVDQPSLVPASFPLDVADNRAARASRLVVIVVDDMVIRPMLEKTKALARAAVHRLGEDALMAYLTTSGMDGVEATADHSMILRAINRVGTDKSKAPKIPERFGSYTSHPTMAERVLLHETGCHTTMLSQAARMVGGPEPMRRIFVYVSPYCSANLFDDEFLNNRDADRVRYLYETLRQSNVTLYGLDPRGEMDYSLSHFASEDITGVNPPPSTGLTRSWNPVVESQGALQELALKTGGFAVTNSNAFEAGLAQIEADLNQYYVLGFYDDDPKPNRFHPVDVKLDRPGLTARFRSGYFSGRLPTKVNKDPMVELSATAIPVADLPLRLFTVTEPRGGSTRVNLVLEVGWTGLEKPDAAGQWHESLDATVIVAKVMSGKIEKKWAVKRPVAVPVTASGPRGFAAYQAVTQVELSPGAYQLRVSARSLTGKTGSVYYSIEIPKGAPASLGGLFLGAPDRVAPTVAASPKGVAPLPFAITLDRVFTRAERLRFFAKVFQLSSSAPRKARLDFIDTADKVVHSQEVPFTGSRQSIDTSVALESLAPGAYKARLSLITGDRTMSRELSLVVRQ